MATNRGDLELQSINSGISNVPLPRSQDQGQATNGRTLTARSSKEVPEGTDTLPFYLRIIKWIALGFIALCVCAGAVLSKVSLVSITGRMFNLTSYPDGQTSARSLLFIQLTILLAIPELHSLMRCLVWGVIGKTTKKFPWPSRSAIIWVSACNSNM